MLLAISAALGCDTFSVGLALASRPLSRRAQFRLVFHFGFFQFAMPIAGWLAGYRFAAYTASYGKMIAALLLALIAVKMIWDSFLEDGNPADMPGDPTRGWTLVLLSLATSIDALGVGVSIGLTGGKLLLPSLCIGITASLMTYVGIRLGRLLAVKVGRRAGLFGGLVLIIIAVRFLIS